MRYLKYSLPVLTLLCLAFIFLNSIQKTASLEKKEEAVKGAVEQVVESITDSNISIKEKGKSIISKSAHVLEYAAFSTLLIASVLFLHGKREGLFSSAMFACCFVAITDEHLQTLNVNRTASVSDVMIDLAACLVGYSFAHFVFWLAERRKNGKASSHT
jgi:VanZ family protein